MDLEEKDGRQPRPESENPENQNQRDSVSRNEKEERRPAYRATRDGGGYQMEGANRPVAKRRPVSETVVWLIITDLRTVALSRKELLIGRPTFIRRKKNGRFTAPIRRGTNAILICRPIRSRPKAGHIVPMCRIQGMKAGISVHRKITNGVPEYPEATTDREASRRNKRRKVHART